MNVAEINPGTKENLTNYAIATVVLTAFTAWLVIALQLHSSFWPPGSGMFRRIAWPVFFVAKLIGDAIRDRRGNVQRNRDNILTAS